ncbi:MAG: nitrous oxide reductase family maturation protein NosD [Promethearchaeota archaeon]
MRIRLKKEVQMSLIISLLSILIITPVFGFLISIHEKNKHSEEITISSSKYWDLTGSSIYIDNNWSATEIASEWCNGKGTFGDPYIIENVTIDCLGNESGITIRNTSEYFIIRNCTIFNSGSYDYGIILDYVNNSKILASDLSSNGYGIALGECYNNTISYNILTDNFIGLLIGGGDNNTISYNTVENNLFIGFTLYQTEDNKFIYNSIIDNYGNGVWALHSYNNLMEKNQINNNVGNGLYLQSCQGNSIINNEISNSGENGILLEDNDYSIISKNVIDANSKNGIYLETFIYSDGFRGLYNTISENKINYNLYGIRLDYSDHNQINKNEIKQNKYHGIQFNNSDYLEIYGNEIDNHQRGINILNSINNDLSSNIMKSNRYGIVFTDSHKNIVYNNTILNSVKCFVEIGRCIDNSFEDNTCQELPAINEGLILGILLLSSALALLVVYWIVNRSKRN